MFIKIILLEKIRQHMKYLYTIIILIVFQIGNSINVGAQEKQLFDSLAAVYDPSMKAVKDSIRYVLSIKQEIRDSIADIDKRKAAFIPYNTKIYNLKLQLNSLRNNYDTDKRQIVSQLRAYKKSRPYNSYKKLSKMYYALGITCSITSFGFLIGSLSANTWVSTSGDYFVPAIGNLIFASGFYYLGKMYKRKYLQFKAADTPFQLSAAPVFFQNQKGLSYGIGLNFTF